MVIDRARTKIYAEQYIEVSTNFKAEYEVELVIEPFLVEGSKGAVLRYGLGSYSSLKEADEVATGLRLIYDKVIYKYNLM